MDRLEEELREMADVIAHLAMDNKLMIASAESCTGGLIARTLTSIPGASNWYDTGIVSYTYDSKHNVLGIEDEILMKGLVTPETAQAMAKRVAELADADYAVSTTGVCGPAASEGYEPCTAWVGIKTPKGVSATSVVNEDQGRDVNTRWVVLQALHLLTEAIRKEKERK